MRHLLIGAAALAVLATSAAAQSTTQSGIAATTQSDAAAAFHPAGMEGPKTGAIRVIVTPGTKDGPAIGHDLVTIELFSQSKAIRTYKTQIGDGGVVEIHDLPLDVPFQPVITVEHAGALEELIGPPMHKYQPAVEIPMKVYEATTEKPAWTSGICHVTVEPVVVKGGLVLHVAQMMGGFDPTDKAWIGDHNGTLTLQLPSSAQDILLGQGLAESNPTIANGTITRGKAMLPGSTEYDCGYTLSVANGAASLSFTLPADTTLFALYLPATVHIDKCVGLTVSAASGKYGLEGRQLLVGKQLKAGQVVSLDLSGITPPPAPPVPTTLPGGDQTTLHLARPPGQ